MSVYCLPPGVRFAELFAQGFWERFGKLPPEEIAQILILTNNSWSVLVLSDALADSRKAHLLPKFQIVEDLGVDPVLAPDLPPVIDQVRRHLRLTRLVEKYLQAQRRGGEARTAPLAAAPELANSLANLLDECDEAGIDAAELDGATSGEHAVHWDRNLRFFDIVRAEWPRIAEEKEEGAIGPMERQCAVIKRQIEEWEQTPPTTPVIFAGTTGSKAPTAMLMAAVAHLKDGKVVLPGFDRSLEPDIWEAVAKEDVPEHPQAPFVGLLGKLGLSAHDVKDWTKVPPRAARRRLLAQAMRPAPITDAWHAEADELSTILEEAVTGVKLLEAPDQRHEAAAVALAVREALTVPEKKVLILTRDAALSRRIIAELRCFDITPLDSHGTLLAQSPPGVFLRLIVDVAEDLTKGQADPVGIAALLSHSFMAADDDRIEHERHTLAYERAVLRRRIVSSNDMKLPGWPEPNAEEKKPTAAQKKWLANISNALDPLVQAIKQSRLPPAKLPKDEQGPLCKIVCTHIAAAEALSGGGAKKPKIWASEAGMKTYALMKKLADASDAFDDFPLDENDIPVKNYRQLLAELMRNQGIRQRIEAAHPRVSIMGTRESRVASADLVILAGLNEGSWPHSPTADPWLSRPMRAALGLPPLERTVGLSAHDFLQAAMAPEVIFSRSLRVDGTPTVASRWLTRMEILITGLDRHRGVDSATYESLKCRGQEILDHLHWIHRPDEELCKTLPPATRPAPRPPAEARPRRLSVTSIERLISDPYSIYAQRVLRLSPLDPLGNPVDFRDRGRIVHALLERFTEAIPDELPDNAAERLGQFADEILAEETAVPPALKRIWRARVGRFTDWFLEGERNRRAAGSVVGTEVAGEMDLSLDVTDLPDFRIKITARADRVDKLNSGQAAIYDYKAGEPPRTKQIENGFNHQLHLQAAILAVGGFKKIPALETEIGEYIGLTGSGKGGKVTTVNNLSSEVENHLDHVKKLLSAYAQEGTSYSPRFMSDRPGQWGDYDHLARHGEWEDGSG